MSIVKQNKVMENIYSALAQAEQLQQTAKDLVGKVYGLTLAVVADVQDPLKLDRIKVLVSAKGAKTTSDWLTRLTPSPYLSVPLVVPGDTVVVGFFDGSPNEGVYLGIINNVINPPQPVTENYVVNPPADLVVAPQRDLWIAPKNQLTIVIGQAIVTISSSGAVNFSGISSFSLNGKQVATVGAKDSDSDRLVSKGWDDTLL